LVTGAVVGTQPWNLGTFTIPGYSSASVDAQLFVDWDLGSFTFLGENSASVDGYVPTDWDLGSFTMIGVNASSVTSGTVWVGAAVLAADSQVHALAGYPRSAVVALHGVSTCIVISEDADHASAHLAGGSSITATLEVPSFDIDAALVATGIFFVNPAKVLVIPFFSATAVPAQGVHIPLPRAQPGIRPSSVTIGPHATTRNSQTGGVPNKG
jgi:hypothetical protein